MTARSPWAGKTALVSGGKRGLGRAYAEELARRGCRVVITSRRPDDADVAECLAVLSACAPTAEVPAPLAIGWDMTCRDGDAAAWSALRAANVDVALFVHAAHVFPPHKMILAMTARELSASLEHNVVSPFALCRRLCRSMARGQLGRILFVGSLAASLGGVGQAAYITEKSALAGLMRAFSAEFGRRNVLVNMVEPGIIDTENVREGVLPSVRAAFARRAFPGRLATPEDVVLASIGLLDPRQSFATGQVLRIAGGVDGGGGLEGGGDDA